MNKFLKLGLLAILLPVFSSNTMEQSEKEIITTSLDDLPIEIFDYMFVNEIGEQKISRFSCKPIKELSSTIKALALVNKQYYGISNMLLERVIKLIIKNNILDIPITGLGHLETTLSSFLSSDKLQRFAHIFNKELVNTIIARETIMLISRINNKDLKTYIRTILSDDSEIAQPTIGAHENTNITELTIEALPIEILLYIFKIPITQIMSGELIEEYAFDLPTSNLYKKACQSAAFVQNLTSRCKCFYQFRPDLINHIRQLFNQKLINQWVRNNCLISSCPRLLEVVLLSRRVNIDESVKFIDCNKHITILQPLLNATSKNNTTLVTILLNLGANTEIRDQDGNTPLMIAISRKNLELVELFLDHNANVNVINNEGETLLRLAKEDFELIMLGSIKGNPEALGLLIDRIQKQSITRSSEN